jgi:hypothetical protein
LTSFFLAASLLLAAASADAVASREARCTSLKEKVSGRFFNCMLKADAKFERNDEKGQRYRKKILCRDSLTKFFARAEGTFGGACATRGDAAEVISDLEGIADDVTNWIKFNEGTDGPVAPRIACGSGTSLDLGSNVCLWNGLVAPDACGNGLIESDEECDFGALGGNSCESLGFGVGTLACSAGCRFDSSACFDPEEPSARFEVNNDGTVRDNLLNLLWEAKYDPRTVQNRDMLFLKHNLDRIFLFRMNRPGDCWASHCRWRLPTQDELSSLAGLGRFCSESRIPTELCRQGETLLYWSSTGIPGTDEQVGVGVPGSATSRLHPNDLARAIAVMPLD